MHTITKVPPSGQLTVPEVDCARSHTPHSRSWKRRKPVQLSYPREVDSYSVHQGGESDGYAHNRSRLRRVIEVGRCRNVVFDLNDGFDAFAARLRQQQSLVTGEVENVRRSSQKPPMNDLMRCVSENKPLLEDLPEFVCMRRTLQFIMCTPYEVMCRGKYARGWTIAARKIADSWYLCEIWEKQPPPPNQQQFEYWGSRFEKCMTTSPDCDWATGGCCRDNSRNVSDFTSPEHATDAESGYSAGAGREGSFYSVLYSLFGDHSLLYGAEVDCCREEDGDPPSVYSELKTCWICHNEKPVDTFARRNFLKWWAQSYLAGVKTIICGFRDDMGVVRQVRTYYTSELQKLALESGICWDPSVCLQFLDQMLNHVKNVVRAEEEVHVFEFRPPSREITSKVYPVDNSPCEFPPKWFCNIKSAN